MAQGVLDPPTDFERELARRERERRRKMSESKRGVSLGPMKPEHKRSISEGLKRSWAVRKAALQAVMDQEEALSVEASE